MQHIVSDSTGLVHLIASIIALIAGTWILITTKGTKRHKQIGYLYSIAMTVLLITSFMIYNLYGKFGIFHWLAVVSTISLIGGILPMLVKKPAGFLTLHFSFMYWSVFGLYGAFVAEVLVRIPKAAVVNGVINPVFYYMVGLAVFVVMGIGNIVFYKKKKTWAKFEKTH